MTKTKKKSLYIIIGTVLLLAGLIIAVIVAFEINICSPKGKAADVTKWELILINKENHIPDNYTIHLIELSNGQKVDERIYPDLQKMFDDMRADGVYPFVREGYRTADEQKAIIKDKLWEHLSQGHDIFESFNLTFELAMPVGNSEHQTGLAVDINADLDKCELWDVYTWLNDNAYKYGFILRYPPDKSSITGIDYEPWHYRYVGKEAAKEIYENDFTLEEYIIIKNSLQ